MRNSHVSCFLLKSQKKISWNMRFSHETGDTRFFHRGLYKKKSCLMRKSHVSRENLISQEKISCLKRKSHVLSVLGPPQWENLMSYQFGAPLQRKYHVSYLRRKSHVSRENLMSFHFWVPPQRENLLSPVSWENLIFHEIFFWDFWRKHETWEFLMRQEIFSWDRRQEIFLLGGPKLIRHEIFSWDMRLSHETGDRIFSR